MHALIHACMVHLMSSIHACICSCIARLQSEPCQDLDSDYPEGEMIRRQTAIVIQNHLLREGLLDLGWAQCYSWEYRCMWLQSYVSWQISAQRWVASQTAPWNRG